jgi:hypothetical protein
MLRLLFEEGRVAEYLRKASLGGEPMLFVHVPKTAGSSLRRELAAILRPEANIEVDYTDTSRPFLQRMDEAVEQFLAADAETPMRFASGHILHRHVARIRAQRPRMRAVTLLRDPVARVVSDWRHQSSSRHPGSDSFARAVPTLESYLALGSERNKSASHLVPHELKARGDIAGCIAYIMDNYAFVGIQEMYPLSFRTLTAMAGQPAWPQLRANVGAGPEPDAAEVAALAPAIREANALDQAIYEHFRQRLSQVRDTLVSALDAPLR